MKFTWAVSYGSDTANKQIWMCILKCISEKRPFIQTRLPNAEICPLKSIRNLSEHQGNDTHNAIVVTADSDFEIKMSLSSV